MIKKHSGKHSCLASHQHSEQMTACPEVGRVTSSCTCGVGIAPACTAAAVNAAANLCRGSGAADESL